MHKLENDKVYRHFIERSRLSGWKKFFLYGATAVLWLSGLIWVLFRFYGNNSYVEPLSMKVHGAAAMAFLLVLGSLISTHMRRGWVLKRNRVSGVIIASVCASLTITGWILYYLATENVRNAVSLIHWIVGLALPLIIYLHILAWRWEQNR